MNGSTKNARTRRFTIILTNKQAEGGGKSALNDTERNKKQNHGLQFVYKSFTECMYIFSRIYGIISHTIKQKPTGEIKKERKKMKKGIEMIRAMYGKVDAMTEERYTYRQLVDRMERNGNNLADVAVGRMMEMVEEETGIFPNWSDVAPEWVVKNCIGR